MAIRDVFKVIFVTSLRGKILVERTDLYLEAVFENTARSGWYIRFTSLTSH